MRLWLFFVDDGLFLVYTDNEARIPRKRDGLERERERRPI